MTKFLSVAALGFAILIFTQAFTAYSQAQELHPVSCSGSAVTPASCSGSLASCSGVRTPVRSGLASVRSRIVNRQVAPVRNTLLRLQSVRASCGG